MLKTIRELITFRNIVPLIAIVLAFLGAGGFLQQYLSTDQIVMALLGVLALDTVVERLGYLKRIEDGIKALGAGGGKPLFMSRTALNAQEPFEQLVARGRDVLIAGATLVGTAGPLRTFFRTTVEQGTNLRFMLLDPESPCLELAARIHGISSEAIRNDIISSLGHLQQLRDSVNNGRKGAVQIKLFSTIPDSGIAMRDSNLPTGEIRCELYLYQTDVAGRPAFRLTPADGMIYRQYRDAIERLWSDAKPWTTRREN